MTTMSSSSKFAWLEPASDSSDDPVPEVTDAAWLSAVPVRSEATTPAAAVDASTDVNDEVAAPTLVMAGSSGGSGVSVLSALVAARCSDLLGAPVVRAEPWSSGMVDDAAERVGLPPAPNPQDAPFSLSEAGAAAARAGAAAGVYVLPPMTAAAESAEHPGPLVLVISVRPDLLNRARPVLAEWAHTGVLSRATIVLNYQFPVGGWSAMGDAAAAALADLPGGPPRLLALEYDPALGDGLAINHLDLSDCTVDVVDDIAQSFVGGGQS